MEDIKYDMKIISKNTYKKTQIVTLNFSKINRFRGVCFLVGKRKFYALLARTDDGIENVIGTFISSKKVENLEKEIVKAYENNQKVFYVPDSTEYSLELSNYMKKAKNFNRKNFLLKFQEINEGNFYNPCGQENPQF